MNLNDKDNYQKPQRISEAITESLSRLEESRTNGEIIGTPSGFLALDLLTHGWQKQELVVVASRPAMGKSSFALTCARNAAVDFAKPTAIFSLEMSSVQLMNRMISGEAEIELERIRKGNLQEWEWQQLHSKIGRLNEAPLFIDDTPNLDIFDLKEKCRRLKEENDIELVIVDYLQLLRDRKSKNCAVNREQEIGNIVRELKSIARELSITILAISQLSRALESRPGINAKRPMLIDLRESGSIEQDADVVLFLYRPEYYGITEDEQGRSQVGVAEIIIAKQRNGETGFMPLKFLGKFVKFLDMEDDLNAPSNSFAAAFGMYPSQDFEKQSNVIIRPVEMDDYSNDDPPF